MPINSKIGRDAFVKNFFSRVAHYCAPLALLLFMANTVDNGEPDHTAIDSFTPVEVALTAITDVDILSAEGIIVSNVRSLTATVYVTSDDRSRLQALGFTFIETRTTPKDLESRGDYHNHAALTEELNAYADAFPDITRLISIGNTTQGRALWALLITDNPDIEEDEPEFKYSSTIHGDEPVGTEISLYMIDRLLNDYGTDPRITALVDDTAIWFLPLMNPDGFEAISRVNARGRDLNRSFPAFPSDFTDTFYDGEDSDITGREAEVQAVMAWTLENNFVLSANFHGGALVMNYPYDDDGLPSGNDTPTPDDLLFEDISLRYADLNPPMSASPIFPDGITNGSEWFSIEGGMQDWIYRYTGGMDVTIELSNIKRPPSSTLHGFWLDNEASMLAYMEAVHIGVRGIVTERRSGEPLWASVSVTDNTHRVYTDSDVGDYHRLLLPGQYDLTYFAPGFIPYVVKDIAVSENDATRVDVSLSDGDIDMDGITGAPDIQLVINAILDLPVAVAGDPDVNGGGVSATDLQSVINKALGRTTP